LKHWQKETVRQLSDEFTDDGTEQLIYRGRDLCHLLLLMWTTIGAWDTAATSNVTR
jgi:hypothetical protein